MVVFGTAKRLMSFEKKAAHGRPFMGGIGSYLKNSSRNFPRHWGAHKRLPKKPIHRPAYSYGRNILPRVKMPLFVITYFPLIKAAAGQTWCLGRR